MKMVKPLGARVVVKRLEAPKPASSLIEIPDTVKEKERPSQFGLVLAIGKLVQGGFDVGDTVILADYAGAPCTVELDDEVIDAAVVTEEHVLAVVED